MGPRTFACLIFGLICLGRAMVPADAAIDSKLLGARYDETSSKIVFRAYSSRATRIELHLYADANRSPAVATVCSTRVPSMGRGSRPRESNFCCLPGRAGGTPILVEGVLRERFGLTHVNLDTGWAVSPRRHMPCTHQDSRLEQLLTELGCPHDIALSDSPSFAHRAGELIARSAIKHRSHPDAKNRPLWFYVK
jgi:hypothetical protein